MGVFPVSCPSLRICSERDRMMLRSFLESKLDLGCTRFNLLQRRQQPTESTAETNALLAVEEKPQWEVILNNGSVQTFAPLKVETQRRDERRPQLIIRPYFGSFAGHKVTFDLKKTDTIKVKIEGCTQRLTLYHRNDAKLLGVRDRCLRFAHDASSHQLISLRNSWTSAQPSLRRKPLSLSFLCEQTILLHLDKLPVERLPVKYKNFQTSTVYQDITINVCPKKCSPTPTLLMRVKKNLSVSELEWMVCHRLSLPDPSFMKLYHNDYLSPLDSDLAIPTDYAHLDCILEASSLQLRDSPLLVAPSVERHLVVSVVGQGIKEFSVPDSCSYRDFDAILRSRFALQSDSFLYIPQIMRTHRDPRVLVPLEPDNLGIIGKHLPSSSARDADLHAHTLGELGVFSVGLLTVFEVSGPFVPVCVKSFVCMSDSSNLSSGDNFAFVAIRPYAVGVNPRWEIDIFFKYIECISGFPCQGLCVGKKRVEGLLSQLVTKQWTKRDKHGHMHLRTDIPRIIYC